jgi:pyruvyltransferase
MTRQKLLEMGIDCPENYGDPLLLMPCMNNSRIHVDDKIVGIIPHYIDKNHDTYKLLKHNLENDGYIVKFIDIGVGDDHDKLIGEINQCKYIVSSSLHGVMMGVVYKKQTVYIQFSENVIGGTFKFQDFFKSVDIEYTNKNIYDSSVLENVIIPDYNKIQAVGEKLLELIPFINEERKVFLKKKYIEFTCDNI